MSKGFVDAASLWCTGVLVLLVSVETWNQTGRVNSPLSGVSMLLPLAALHPSVGVQVSCPLCSMLAASGDAEGASQSPIAEEGWSSFPSAGTHPCHLRRVAWLIGQSCVHGGDMFSSSMLLPTCPPPVWLFHNPGLTDLSSWD